MSTRKRAKNSRPSNGPAEPALPNSPAPTEHMPPPRPRKKGLTPVSKPLQNISLNKFIYILTGLAVLLAAFYTWRLTVWKTQAGGWWNLALGRRPLQTQTQQANAGVNVGSGAGAGAGVGGSRDKDVADRVVDLASALGIQPTVLASALVDILKENVPPSAMSSLSSSAAAAAQTGGNTGEEQEVLNALLGNPVAEGEGSGAAAVAGGVRDAFDSVVGMDEPLDMD